MPQALLEAILESCAELGIFMVVDECFLDFVEEPEKHTLKGKLAEYPKNISLLCQKLILRLRRLQLWLSRGSRFLVWRIYYFLLGW